MQNHHFSVPDEVTDSDKDPQLVLKLLDDRLSGLSFACGLPEYNQQTLHSSPGGDLNCRNQRNEAKFLDWGLVEPKSAEGPLPPVKFALQTFQGPCHLRVAW